MGAMPKPQESQTAPSEAQQPREQGPATHPEGPAVEQPAKLLRIAMMVRETLEEVRRAPVDENGRRKLGDIHLRVLEELKTGMSGSLADELDRVALPLSAGTPSESEIRLAQAQLLGWLEGIFQGIQAAIATQQLAAQAQLEEMRRRGLPPGMGETPTPPGQYL